MAKLRLAIACYTEYRRHVIATVESLEVLSTKASVCNKLNNNQINLMIFQEVSFEIELF